MFSKVVTDNHIERVLIRGQDLSNDFCDFEILLVFLREAKIMDRSAVVLKINDVGYFGLTMVFYKYAYPR